MKTNYFKNRCLMAVLSFFCSMSFAIAGGKALVIEQRSGSSTTFVLAESPIITFSNHVLNVNVNGSNTGFEISDINYFFFSEYDGIELASSDKVKISCLSDDKVIIDGIDLNDRVFLCSLDGRVLSDCVTRNGNQADISLSALPVGTYIINVQNKQTIKIFKK